MLANIFTEVCVCRIYTVCFCILQINLNNAGGLVLKQLQLSASVLLSPVSIQKAIVQWLIKYSYPCLHPSFEGLHLICKTHAQLNVLWFV